MVLRFKSPLLFPILIALMCSLGAAQQLPSNFEYKRETGQETGIPMFTLKTDDDSVAYDASKGIGFEALGALVQPERGKYGLMFMNAKPKRTLLFGKSKLCSMKIGGEVVTVKPLQALPAKKISRLLVEFMIIGINREVFEQLVVARDVFIKCGSVGYSLDQDNIDALKWFGDEINQDLKRRNVRSQ